MVDAERGGDGADLPVFAEIEAANLGVQFGRDPGEPPGGTRDGLARAVEGATRFRGRKPYIATRPPGARPAIDPSACQRRVCVTRAAGGKSDPSRARDTRAGDRDGRGALRDSGGVAGAPPGSRRGGQPRDTPTSNTRGHDHTTSRSRRVGCSTGRFSGEAVCPRRRSGIAFRLDTTVKPWHKKDDWLGPSEHRGGHRGPGGSSSRSSPRTCRGPQLMRRAHDRPREEAVDADAAVDAQDASTAAWKSR